MAEILAIAGAAVAMLSALSIPYKQLEKVSRRVGMHKLGNEPDNPVADICFVHGLSGHWRSTWLSPKSEDKTEFWWPADVQELTKARVLLYGYDSVAPTAEFLARRTLYHHAQSLVDSLAKERAQNPRRPLIFVAHSLGGVIVESALILSSQAHKKDDEIWSISFATTGIIFLGTPRTGPLSSFGSALKRIAKQSGIKPKVLKQLDPESQILESYLEAFTPISTGIPIKSFFESRHTGSSGFIVPPPKNLRGASFEQLDANHMDMAKFERPQDNDYMKVKEAIRELIDSSESQLDKKRATRYQDPHASPTQGRRLPKFRVTSPLPLRLTNFVGKKSTFEWLRETLIDPCPPDCASTCHKVNIYGPGGSGKTSIALEFAYRFRDHFSSIFWIPAHTQATVDKVFVDIAHSLGMPVPENRQETLSLENAYLVLEWLMYEHNSDWLLIFDDVDFDATPALEKLIPNPTCVHGHVIITSRAPIIATSVKRCRVTGLSPEEARELLYNYTDLSRADDSDIDELLDHLDSNPLALTSAGKFIKKSKSSLEKYLKHLERSRFSSTSYTNSLNSTFLEAIERISGRPAEMLFSMCCMMTQTVIPLWIFEESSNEHISSKRTLRDSIAELEKANLIIRQPNQAHIMIHRLIRDCGKVSLENDLQLKASRELCEIASYVVAVLRQNPSAVVGPSNNDVYDFDKELIELIVDALEMIVSHSESSKDWNMNLVELGKFCQANGKFSEAEGFFQLHIERDGGDISETELRLGITRRRTGGLLETEMPANLSKTSTQFGDMVKTAKDSGDGKRLEDLRSLNRDRGDPHQELEGLQQIVTAQEAVLGPTHPSTLDSIQELSNRFLDQGYLDQAESKLRSLLTSYRALYGSGHAVVATTLQNLASVCESAGKLGDAEQYCEEAFIDYEQRLGFEHTSSQKCRAQLAHIYYLQGRYKESQELFRATVGRLARTMGHESTEMLRIKENYAQTLIRLRRIHNDFTMSQQDLETLRDVLKLMEAHPDMTFMSSRETIANVLSREDEGHR